MRVLALVRRRDRLPTLAAFAVVLALVAGGVVAVGGLLAGAADRLVRADLAERAGADLVARAGLRLDAEDPTGQDARVRASLATALAGARVPARVERSVAAETLGGPPASPDRRVVLLSDPAAPTRSELVAGAWPSSPDETAVQADAAAALGVAPGDVVELDGASLRVVGTWRAEDPRAAAWVGDRTVEDGTSEEGYGPLLVEESAWATLADLEPRARWAWLPDTSAAGADDLAALLRGWDDLDEQLTVRGQSAAGLQRDGALPRVAGELVPRVVGLRAVAPAVWLVLLAVAVVALAELAQLLTTAHRRELLLLRSRGAPPRRIAATTAAEVATAGLLGSAVGAAAATALLPALSVPAPSVSATTLAGSLAVVVGSVVVAALLAGASVLGVVAEPSRRRTARRPSARPSRRLLLAAGVAPVALLAGVAVWQLRLYGSLVTPTASGGASADPLAVLAPALLLVAVVLGSTTALPLLGLLLRRRGDRQGPVAVLVARSVARRPLASVACLTAVALAGATVVLAGAVTASWSTSLDLSTRLRTGADLHLADLDGRALDPAAVAAVAGADAVAPVDVQGAGELGSLVAAAPAALRWLPADLAARWGTDELLPALDDAPTGLTLPEEAGAVRLEVASTGLRRPAAVTAHLVDGLGGEHRLVLARSGARSGASYAADLPDGAVAAAPVTLTAIDVELRGSLDPGARASWEVLSLSAPAAADGTGPAVPVAERWVPRRVGEPAGPPPTAGPLGFLPGPQDGVVRLAPAAAAPLPVGVSRPAADRLALGVGDRLTLTLEGTYDLVDAEVAAVLEAVPGSPTDDAVLVDRAALVAARLASDGPVAAPDLWVRSARPEATAALLRERLPATVRVETATAAAQRTGAAPVVAAWWTVAGLAGLLALVVVTAVTHERLRERRAEVAALRALGLLPQEQAALRRRELAAVLGIGLGSAALAGAAAVGLVVGPLVRTVLPASTLDVGLVVSVAVVPVVAGVGALAVAASALVVRHGTAVARQARSARPEGVA